MGGKRAPANLEVTVHLDSFVGSGIVEGHEPASPAYRGEGSISSVAGDRLYAIVNATSTGFSGKCLADSTPLLRSYCIRWSL
jgi:hypothetical protein